LAARQGCLAAHPCVAPARGCPARDQITLRALDPAAARANGKANKLKFEDIFGG